MDSSFINEHKKLVDSEQEKRNRKTLVINAFGGPGAGKTVACMDICQQLKKLGYNAEYVSEVAKDYVYAEDFDKLDGTEAHQFEILQEQMKRVDTKIGKVDFVVTDSPILLNGIYNKELTKEYSAGLLALHNQYQNFVFVVNRDVSQNFQQEGRIHNLEESQKKDCEITELLDKNEIFYGTYSHDKLKTIVQNSIKTLERIRNGSPVVPKRLEQKESIAKSKISQNHNFYDILMKKLFGLSVPVVVDFINAVFGTDYDRNKTQVTHLDTEYIRADSKELRSDLMFLVEGKKYHLEFQMKNDDSMSIRLFDYEFEEARENRIEEPNRMIMEFARPKVIYLQHNRNTPDKYVLELRFGEDGTIIRNAETVKALSMTPEQLAEKKLYLLLPFQLLRTRRLAEKDLKPETKEKILSDYKKTMKSCIIILDELYKNGKINDLDSAGLFEALNDINKHLYRNVPEAMKGSETSMVEGRVMSFGEECEARGEAKMLNEIMDYVKKHGALTEDKLQEMQKNLGKTHKNLETSNKRSPKR